MITLLTKSQNRGLAWVSLALIGYNLLMAIAAVAFHHPGFAAGHFAFAALCYGLARYYVRAAK